MVGKGKGRGEEGPGAVFACDADLCFCVSIWRRRREGGGSGRDFMAYSLCASSWLRIVMVAWDGEVELSWSMCWCRCSGLCGRIVARLNCLIALSVICKSATDGLGIL